jgi:hypothetical protein
MLGHVGEAFGGADPYAPVVRLAHAKRFGDIANVDDGRGSGETLLDRDEQVRSTADRDVARCAEPSERVGERRFPMVREGGQ